MTIDDDKKRFETFEVERQTKQRREMTLFAATSATFADSSPRTWILQTSAVQTVTKLLRIVSTRGMRQVIRSATMGQVGLTLRPFQDTGKL